MLDDEQRGRLLVELLADLFTDGLSFLAAARAKSLGRRQVMDDPPAGQFPGQTLATMTPARA
jgi:hypothetical protein